MRFHLPGCFTMRFPNPHLYAWAGFFCFAVLVSCVKALGPQVPVSLTIAARSLLGLVCLLPLVHRAGWRNTLVTRYPARQALRACCGVFGLGLNFYALSHLPLADAQGLSQLYPVFLVVLAPFVLDEYAGWRQWLALGIGLSGAVIIARSHGGTTGFIAIVPALCVMGSAVSSAVGDLLARYMGRRDTPLTITIYLFALLGLASFCWWLGGWVLGLHGGLESLHSREIVLLLAIGVSGAAAQLCIVQGFKFLPAATMGTYASLGLLWAVLFGFIFFDERPGGWFIVGAALILIAARFAALTPPSRAPIPGDPVP